MIVYDGDPEDIYELEQVLLNHEFELLIYQLSLEFDEGREIYGDDISLMLDPERMAELSQSITNLQTHIFYNEKPKLVK